MTGDIGREGMREAEHQGELVEVLVIATEGGGILTVGLLDIGAGEDREEIRSGGKGIAVEKGLHLGLDSHLETLTGLATSINEATMSDIFRTKIGEVDKGEPTGTETEDERVAREGETAKHAQEGLLAGVMTQAHQTCCNVERAEGSDERGGNSSLLRMGNGGTDIGKGFPVGYQTLADGLVIDGLKVAQVEGRRVALDATVEEPLLIGDEQFGTDPRERDVATMKGLQIMTEAIATVTIILSQTQLVFTIETGYFGVQKGEEKTFFFHF